MPAPDANADTPSPKRAHAAPGPHIVRADVRVHHVAPVPDADWPGDDGFSAVPPYVPTVRKKYDEQWPQFTRRPLAELPELVRTCVEHYRDQPRLLCAFVVITLSLRTRTNTEARDVGVACVRDVLRALQWRCVVVVGHNAAPAPSWRVPVDAARWGNGLVDLELPLTAFDDFALPQPVDVADGTPWIYGVPDGDEGVVALRRASAYDTCRLLALDRALRVGGGFVCMAQPSADSLARDVLDADLRTLAQTARAACTRLGDRSTQGQRTAVWYARRAGRINASAAGPLLGLSEYGGPEWVAGAIAAYRLPHSMQRLPGESIGSAADFGSVWEDVVRKLACELFDITAEDTGSYVGRGKDRIFSASPDGVVTHHRGARVHALLELKSPVAPVNPGKQTTPVPPDTPKHIKDEYVVQMTMQRMLAGENDADKRVFFCSVSLSGIVHYVDAAERGELPLLGMDVFEYLARYGFTACVLEFERDGPKQQWLRRTLHAAYRAMYFGEPVPDVLAGRPDHLYDARTDVCTEKSAAVAFVRRVYAVVKAELADLRASYYNGASLERCAMLDAWNAVCRDYTRPCDVVEPDPCILDAE